MTEKRFRLGYVCGDFGLIDNDEWIDLHSMSENCEKNVQICINKMNELADENEQLENENQKLDEKICLLTMDLIKTKSYEQLEKELNRIKNENEQLKDFIRKEFPKSYKHILEGFND